LVDGRRVTSSGVALKGGGLQGLPLMQGRIDSNHCHSTQPSNSRFKGKQNVEIQRRINTLVRERVVTVRRAGQLVVDNMQGEGESASSLGSEISKAFEAIYGIRLHVFKLKFGLKLLVSGLQSGGVFALLFVGGIMVLNGKTEIGIVVAFISGLDRVIDPWRELIAFVRSTSAAKVQFDLIEGTLGKKL
jgi:hypothetical protein